MSEKKAQAPKQHGVTCEIPKNTPAYLLQGDSPHAHPDLIALVQAQHKLKSQAVRTLTNGKVLLKDTGY